MEKMEVTDERAAEAAEAAGAETVRTVEPGEDRCRYGVGNVVVLGCEHLRMMRGETDEVVGRVRSDAAEEAVMEAVRACGKEPDFFYDRWHPEMGDGGVLVSSVLFEAEDDAKRFAEEIGKSGVGKVWIVEDKGIADESAWHFSFEWEKARTENMSRNSKVIGDAKERHADWVGRIVLTRVRDGVAMKNLGAKITDEMDCEVPYCPARETDGRILIGFACDDMEQADRLGKVIEGIGLEWRNPDEVMTETELQVSAMLLAKLDQQRVVAEKMEEMREKNEKEHGDWKKEQAEG